MSYKNIYTTSSLIQGSHNAKRTHHTPSVECPLEAINSVTFRCSNNNLFLYKPLNDRVSYFSGCKIIEFQIKHLVYMETWHFVASLGDMIGSGFNQYVQFDSFCQMIVDSISFSALVYHFGNWGNFKKR